MPYRVETGLATEQQQKAAEVVFANLEIWVLVQNETDKQKLGEYFKKEKIDRVKKIFIQEDVRKRLDEISNDIEQTIP